jgi:hypothetical protein
VTPFRVREDDWMRVFAGRGWLGRILPPTLRLLSGSAEATTQGRPIVLARHDFALAKEDIEALIGRGL